MLDISRVSKHFGGVHALADIDLQVQPGEILGLIGPNGAGKTTLFNVITGVYAVSTGHIAFQGRDITNWRADRVARTGLARTFQSVCLFSQLSVLDNVLLGQSPFARSGLVSLLPVLADRAERRLRREAERCLEQLGLLPLAAAAARELPYALQRKVEIARALAGRPKLLLLDEPAAGFNEQESQDLARDILAIREAGATIVLIEHDMSVVMGVCDRIAVLDFGKKIAEGAPAQVRDDPLVIEAYLGRDES